MTISRPSDHGEVPSALKADVFWSQVWAPVVSFALHGAALAAVLWALQEPVTSPANTAMPLIAMAFVAPPVPASVSATAPVAPAPIEPPAVEPMTAETVPPVESLVAEAQLPPAPKPRPMVEQRPTVKAEPKPQAKPVKASVLSDHTLQSRDAAAPVEATAALPYAAPGPAPAAPQQAAVPVVAPLVSVAPPADYVGLLRQQLERNKVYPRSAQQRRQQGSAMLRIAIDRGGQVLSFKIEQSSGFELLDREVVAMVQRASPLPPIPAGLNTDRLEIVVPVEFFLRSWRDGDQSSP